MTDEKRKQIEDWAKRLSTVNETSYIDNCGSIQRPINKHDYIMRIQGANFGLSLAENRINELEYVLKSLSGWLMRERDNGKLGSIGETLLDGIQKIISHTDNDKG